MLSNILLPPPVYDRRQQVKDIQREHILFNGVSFQGEGLIKRLMASVREFAESLGTSAQQVGVGCVSAISSQANGFACLLPVPRACLCLYIFACRIAHFTFDVCRPSLLLKDYAWPPAGAAAVRMLILGCAGCFRWIARIRSPSER